MLDEISGKELAHYTKDGTGSPFLNDFIFNIYKDDSGDIWLGGGSGTNVCYLFAEKKFRTYPNQFVGCYAELEANQILLGCSDGLFQLDKQTGSIKRLIAGLLVRDVLVMGDDVWICTSGAGLVRYSRKTGAIEKLTTSLDTILGRLRNN